MIRNFNLNPISHQEKPTEFPFVSNDFNKPTFCSTTTSVIASIESANSDYFHILKGPKKTPKIQQDNWSRIYGLKSRF